MRWSIAQSLDLRPYPIGEKGPPTLVLTGRRQALKILRLRFESARRRLCSSHRRSGSLTLRLKLCPE